MVLVDMMRSPLGSGRFRKFGPEKVGSTNESREFSSSKWRMMKGKMVSRRTGCSGYQAGDDLMFGST
jgi:hypothetical protein